MSIVNILYLIAGVSWGMVALFLIAITIRGIIMRRKGCNRRGNHNNRVARGFGSIEREEEPDTGQGGKGPGENRGNL